MKRTLAVAALLLLADLRPAGGFQPPTIICGGPQDSDRKSSPTADGAITPIGPISPITGSSAGSPTALRYANDPHSASDAASATSASALPDTTDPFVLLGLDDASSSGTMLSSPPDQPTLKAAYRRMTRRHHPDAVLTSSSTPEERRRASDDFARINGAYQTLLARRERAAAYWGGGGGAAGAEEFGAQSFVKESTGYASSWASSNAHSDSHHRHWQGTTSPGQDYEQDHRPSDAAEQPLTDLWENTRRTSPFRDLFEKGREKFRRHGAGRRTRVKTSSTAADSSSGTTTSYHSATSSPGDGAVRGHFQRTAPCGGEYASAANCPRDPSLADMFQRSVEDFERFGRAGSRPSATAGAPSAGTYEAATEGCHTREIDDLFSKSAERYVRSGGKRRNHRRAEVNTRTNAAKTEYPYDGAAAVGKAADDFFGNKRSASESRPRSSREPYEASAQPKSEEEKEKRRSSSGGAYAYAFGSAAQVAEEVPEEVRRSPTATPDPASAPQGGPTPSQSYASMLREKEKALEAKIAALRQSEAEAQARYEAYLAQEIGAFDPEVSVENFAAAVSNNEQGIGIDNAAEAERGGVATTTIRGESGSNIKFGINIVGGHGKNNSNGPAYLTP